SRLLFSTITPRPPRSRLFPYTTLFRSHETWWAIPVQGEGQRRPAGLRAQLLLADVVCPAAAALTDAAAQDQQVDQAAIGHVHVRSEEHTSELQSRENLVCRLLLEKKKT